jgi:uncharacterized protein DUF4232
LIGALTATNVSQQACRLSGKPDLRPYGLDDKPLETSTIVTMEFVPPGYVVVEPGQRAETWVVWRSWDGPRAAERVTVSWPGGRKEVIASGPLQPDSVPGHGTNLSTGWFFLVR